MPQQIIEKETKNSMRMIASNILTDLVSFGLVSKDKKHQKMMDDLLLGRKDPAKETIILPENIFDGNGKIRDDLLKHKRGSNATTTTQ